MKCAYHTIGVIYDTVEVAITLGVINTSQCHILHHIICAVLNRSNLSYCILRKSVMSETCHAVILLLVTIANS